MTTPINLTELREDAEVYNHEDGVFDIHPAIVLALIDTAEAAIAAEAEIEGTLVNCYACNGGVTWQEDWPNHKCPICGDLRAIHGPLRQTLTPYLAEQPTT